MAKKMREERIRPTRPKQTVKVEDIVRYANEQLARQDEFATNKFKAGICVMVEEVLHQSNQYQGFNYIYWLEQGNKKWREAGEPDFPEKDKYIHGDGGKECPKYGEYSRMYYWKHLKQTSKPVSEYPYATIYEPQPNGMAHCCMNHSENHATYGARDVLEFISESNAPVYDITKCTKIFAKGGTEILKFGGKLLKRK